MMSPRPMPSSGSAPSSPACRDDSDAARRPAFIAVHSVVERSQLWRIVPAPEGSRRARTSSSCVEGRPVSLLPRVTWADFDLPRRRAARRAAPQVARGGRRGSWPTCASAATQRCATTARFDVADLVDPWVGPRRPGGVRIGGARPRGGTGRARAGDRPLSRRAATCAARRTAMRPGVRLASLAPDPAVGG